MSLFILLYRFLVYVIIILKQENLSRTQQGSQKRVLAFTNDVQTWLKAQSKCDVRVKFVQLVREQDKKRYFPGGSGA